MEKIKENWQYDGDENTDFLWEEESGADWKHLCKTVDGYDIFFAYDEDAEQYKVKQARKGQIVKQGWEDYDGMQELVGELIFCEYSERVFKVLKKTIGELGLRKRHRWSDVADHIRDALWLPLHVVHCGSTFLSIKGMPTDFQDALKWCREMPEVEVLAMHGDLIQDLRQKGFFVE